MNRTSIFTSTFCFWTGHTTRETISHMFEGKSSDIGEVGRADSQHQPSNRALPGANRPAGSGHGEQPPHPGVAGRHGDGRPVGAFDHLPDCMGPHQREKLERLCRHITRPAIGTDRLALTRQGNVRYRLKNRTTTTPLMSSSSRRRISIGGSEVQFSRPAPHEQ